MTRSLFKTVLARLWLVCVTLSLIGIAFPTPTLGASPAETVIGFDDLPHGMEVSNRYQDVGGLGQGVVFTTQNSTYLPIVTTVPTGQAQSGTQVGNISCMNLFEPTAPDCPTEFPFPGSFATFTHTRQHVQVFVGEFSKPDGSPFTNQDGSPLTAHVSLTAFDASHTILARSLSLVTSGAGFHTKLAVTASSADIASVEIDGDQLAYIGIDDFTFDNPVTPASPDFFLTQTPVDQRAPGTVPIGGSLTVPITINRLNGSTGPIQFSASGLPLGVSASFTPTVSDGTSTTLILTAALDAPPTTTGTVIVTGTPGTLSAGSAPRTLTFALTVEQNFTISISGSRFFTLPCSTTDPGDLVATKRRVSLIVILTRGLSFTGTVTLSVAMGLQPGVQASFSPPSLPIGGGDLVDTSTLTITAPPFFTGGTFLQIVAQSGSLPIRTVALGLQAATCSPPPPFNLVWNTTDPNGFPFNPIWAFQAYSPGMASFPDPVHQCPELLSGTKDGVFVGGQLYLGQPPCTTQNINYDFAGQGAGGIPGIFGGAIVGAAQRYFCQDGRDGGGFRGHVNWFPVTNEGGISWAGQSVDQGRDDNDTEMNLGGTVFQHTFTGAGPILTSNGLPVNGGQLHLEFDKGDTIDRFISPWWTKLHQYIGDPTDPGRPGSLIDGHLAVVTGLLGLDTVHTIAPELNPVYAMAIDEQIQDDPADQGWAIFARNWGTEGFCSQQYWPIPSQTISILLPWLSLSATNVEIIQNETVFARSNKTEPPPRIFQMPGVGVLVSITLGPASAHPLAELDLHLKWSYPPGFHQVSPSISTRRVRPLESPDGLHNYIAALYAKLTPAQQKKFLAELGPQPHQSRDSYFQNPKAIVQVPDLHGLPGIVSTSPLHVVGVSDPEKLDQDQRADRAWCAAFNDRIPGAPQSLCTAVRRRGPPGPNIGMIGLIIAIIVMLIIVIAIIVMRTITKRRIVRRE